MRSFLSRDISGLTVRQTIRVHNDRTHKALTQDQMNKFVKETDYKLIDSTTRQTYLTNVTRQYNGHNCIDSGRISSVRI